MGSLLPVPLAERETRFLISGEGLQTLQSGEDWYETATVSDEKVLIYSRPVIVSNQTVYIVQVAQSLTERYRTLQSLGTTLLSAGSFMILLAFGIGWFFSGVTLGPIHRITQTAQTIGDERDFTRRVMYTGPPDEVSQLASTFNSMLSRLQEAYQKVERSLQMQRAFVADVSHELRTPLTTLRGNLGLLRRTPPPEEQADILNDMVDESDRLIRLVNDLLVLARADAKRALAKEPVDVSAVFAETCRQVRQLDIKRIIKLSVPGDLKILGGHDALKQVLLIALDNALKHSTGNINVSAELKGSSVEIRVQDSGEGIPPEKLECIFDRFYRGDNTATDSGFGLGLPIAKALVKAMGGDIKVESELGKGSTVVLQFHAGEVRALKPSWLR